MNEHLENFLIAAAYAAIAYMIVTDKDREFRFKRFLGIFLIVLAVYAAVIDGDYAKASFFLIGAIGLRDDK